MAGDKRRGTAGSIWALRVRQTQVMTQRRSGVLMPKNPALR